MAAVPVPLTDLGSGQGTRAARRDLPRAGMPVFFCDPHSPWQRPINENTNGLLRQYFPKGSDLRVHSPQRLAAVASELNERPPKPWAG
jgi:transposase, IS30 family